MSKKTNILMVMMALGIVFSFPMVSSAETVQMGASSKIVQEIAPEIAPEIASEIAIVKEKYKKYDLGWLKKAETDYVCMVTNKLFTDPQIPVEVDGKTYYGCCEMCKGKLEGSIELREATDPVSGNKVDKATAIIGSGPDNSVYYFENEENMQKFDKQHKHH